MRTDLKRLLSLAGIASAVPLGAIAGTAALCLFTVSCGGGGGTSTPPPPPPPAPAPQVTWSAASVDPILSPAESASQDVTFKSDRSFQNAVIEATGNAASFVTITPSSIANVPAGLDQTVRVSFNVPAGIALGALNGTIHVRSGSQVLTQVLNVNLNVWALIKDTSGFFELKSPPGWVISEIASAYDSKTKVGAKISLTTVGSPAGSAFNVLPEGEFDYGIDVTEASSSQILIDGKAATRFDFRDSQQLLELARIEVTNLHDFRIELSPKQASDVLVMERMISTIRVF